MRRRDLMSAALLLPAAGCVTSSDQNSTNSASAIRSIAIVPAFGDTIQLKYVGFTVFQNKTQDVRTGWDIDVYVRERMVQLLGGRFEIRNVPHSADDITAAISYGERVFGSTSGVSERLKKALPAGAADAIVYVGPSSSADFIGHSNQYFQGLGLYKRGLLLPLLPPTAFTIFRVVVFDGTTFERLASSEARGDATAKVSFEWSGGAYDTIGEAQRAELREKIFALLSSGLSFKLERLPILGGRPAA